MGKTNALAQSVEGLQTFTLLDIEEYCFTGKYDSNASKDHHLYFVGKDNVHEILKYILSRATNSIYCNAFGYDDEELNDILMQKAVDPNVTMLITLDKSQAGGVHEKKILDADRKQNLSAFNTHFAIGQSATHAISHTKGFVVDGKIAVEGSTNWSAGGEGIFVVQGKPGGKGYTAQNNTLAVMTDPDTIEMFRTELIAEHLIAQKQAKV